MRRELRVEQHTNGTTAFRLVPHCSADVSESQTFGFVLPYTLPAERIEDSTPRPYLSS